MATSCPVAPLLCLPIELRYAIYDQLCLSSPLSYPYPSPSPITSIDTRGPPTSLLLTNRMLFEELSTYYFSRCTFRFVAQSFTTHFSPISPGSLLVLRKARRIELLLLPGTMKASATDPSTASITVKQMSAHWLEEHVRLLRDEAKELEVMVVSMRRVSWNHEWSVKCEMEALLRPLEVLRETGVEFRVGEVLGPGMVEVEMREELGGVLERLNL
ncbi:hypothetical protein ST47_g7671 [Ascochyta rabiei]|uniref:Uncharacterized protein n=1 Tax=Didymella rabiei TaxID=5454 RepID=A0A163AI46_DIDRA|nr:hypothetical protein ST47_g7671 [Ascochyta rabiei]